MAYLSFQFAWNIDAATAITAVANHFGVAVSINGAPANVPDHIKTAVERIGADNPANGVETNPAIAFGGLLNGAAGNVQATPVHAQSSAVAAALPTAPVVNPVISQTSAPASSAHAAANPGTVAPTAPAAPANPVGVEFDATGLAWDERIHSGNKTKTPGGEWRTKKGTDKSLIKSVELELRAMYPNGAVATNGAAATASVGLAVCAAPVTPADPNVKKQQALEYARAQGLRVAGAQPIDDTTLATIMSGKPAMVTLSPQQNDWLSIYHAKFNAAYVEYMAGNVADAVGSAPAQQTPITPSPDASAVTVNASVASPMVAGGIATPAPTAPQSELDAAGLPWDARLNIPAKIKDANGVWVQRFDIPADQKPGIIATIRAEMGNVVAAQSIAPTGNAGSTPVAPPPPVVSAADASADFTKLMQWIVANQLAGRITATAGPDTAKQLGFQDQAGNGQLILMRERAEFFPYAVQMLQALGAV